MDLYKEEFYKKHPDFNWETYINFYDDLKKVIKTEDQAIRHYAYHGEKEHRIYKKDIFSVVPVVDIISNVGETKYLDDIKVVAPIPVFGRIPLVELGLKRLKKQNVIPIVIGHEPEFQKLCNDLDVEFIYANNDPLSDKWNAGFLASKKYDPDLVLFLGSSDWCSNNYLNNVKNQIKKYNHSVIAMLGCHFVDIDFIKDKIQLMYWSGYPKNNSRYLEPIGIGRSLSREFLNKVDWLPFESNLNLSLDFSMHGKIKEKKQTIHLLPPTQEKISLLSISTTLWTNKHLFEHFFTGGIKEKDPLLIGEPKNIELLIPNFLEIFEFVQNIRGK